MFSHRQDRKTASEGAELTCSGRLFQTRAAVTGNACSATVDSRVCAAGDSNKMNIGYRSDLFLHVYRNYNRVIEQGRSDGGYIGIYTPKSVYLKFFMWLFCLLDPGQIRYRAIYTHPNQIPGYASVIEL